MRLLIVCAAVFCCACGTEQGLVPFHQPEMTGSFGPDHFLIGQEATLSIDESSPASFAKVDVASLNNQELLMVFFDRKIENFEPGDYSFEYNENTLERQPVEINVCSGDGMSWSYDQVAQTSQMHIDKPLADGSRKYQLHSQLLMDGSTQTQETDATFYLIN